MNTGHIRLAGERAEGARLAGAAYGVPGAMKLGTGKRSSRVEECITFTAPVRRGMI